MGEYTDKLVELSSRKFSTKKRDTLANKNQALPDGSFPIPDVDALRRAIQSIGRAKNPAAAKALIKRRAKALGHPEMIPDGW
jgi:hypothetical protein